MAVSQYLRPDSLVDAVKSYLTPGVMQSASSLVGESGTSTVNAMHGAVPGLLGGLLNYTSTREGADSLAGAMRQGNYGAVLDNPTSLFSGGSATSSMSSVGQSLIGRIFGNRASSVADAIASSSGVRSSSASTLMSLMAPLVLGVMGKMIGSQGVSGASISNLLQSHRSDIVGSSPPGLSRLLGFSGTGPVSSRVSSAPVPSAIYEERERPSGRNWLPLLLIALAALGLLGYLLSRGRNAAERAANATRGVTERAAQTASNAAQSATNAAGNAAQTASNSVRNMTLPGGGNVSVAEGSINYNLAQYLASGAAAPKTFVFDHLNFETGSTQLTPDSGQTVGNLATVLKAYPNSKIQLAGHTDNTGSAQMNQQLSMNRANAVKSMLVSDGVAADRISTVGYGQNRPLAPNDTEENRAKNRRTELTVTSK
ncbi:MAG TPA: OmpA family protein [Terriglobales bacterium]|nr:OmpA family protein [Terriglobales bacterium]